MLLLLVSIWQSLSAGSGEAPTENYRSVSGTFGEVPIPRQRNGFAPGSGNGTAKVLTGTLLKMQVKVLCAVDPWTIEKRLQDGPSLAPE